MLQVVEQHLDLSRDTTRNSDHSLSLYCTCIFYMLVLTMKFPSFLSDCEVF